MLKTFLKSAYAHAMTHHSLVRLVLPGEVTAATKNAPGQGCQLYTIITVECQVLVERLFLDHKAVLLSICKVPLWAFLQASQDSGLGQTELVSNLQPEGSSRAYTLRAVVHIILYTQSNVHWSLRSYDASCVEGYAWRMRMQLSKELLSCKHREMERILTSDVMSTFLRSRRVTLSLTEQVSRSLRASDCS